MSALAHDLLRHRGVRARGLDLAPLPARLNLALEVGAFCVAYFFAYRYGMSFSQATASPFWFPDALLLCALLCNPPRRWWVFLLAPLPIRLLSPVSADTAVWFLLATFAIDAAKGLIAALALRALVANPARLTTVREFALFCAVAVVLVPAGAAFAGGAIRTLLGFEFWTTWQQWFMGDAIANLVITPALLYWIVGWRYPLRLPDWKRSVEGSLVAIGLLVTGYLAFGAQTKGLDFREASFYAPVPFLFWAAIRFGMLGASGAVVVIAVASVAAALVGRGPFAGADPNDTALHLQNFLLLRAVPAYLIAILIEQKNGVERSLRESEERFRNMADFAPVLIWMAEPNRGCTYFNRRWLEFSGRPHAADEGEGWLDSVHPDDRERCRRTYQAAFEAREPLTIEYQQRRGDGEYRLLLGQAIPRWTSEDAFVGFIGSCIDLTDRKHAEAEIHRQRMELTHVGRVSTLGQLAAALAHELNQPLAAILRNAEAGELILAREPLDSGEIRSILKDIRQDDQRAGAVIDRMRSLLKRRDLELEVLELPQLLDQVVVLVRADLLARRVALSLELARDLPRVKGDRVHLQQVLLNLLVNGADAMLGAAPEKRRLTIRVEAVDDRTLEVAVHDQGHGIEEEKLCVVFEPFFTTKASGMGLGLAICKTIIEAHGGRIWATSNEEGGATFRFTLGVVPERLGA